MRRDVPTTESHVLAIKDGVAPPNPLRRVESLLEGSQDVNRSSREKATIPTVSTRALSVQWPGSRPDAPIAMTTLGAALEPAASHLIGTAHASTA